MFKTVAHGWREEAIAQETREIRDLGATLYERVRVLATHFDDMRKGIERTAGSYNKAVASLESRVLPTARKLGELNSMAEKEIHALEDADAKLTTMKAEELVEQTAEKISA